MKITIEGEKKHIDNLMKEKSILVKRGLITIKIVGDAAKKVEPKPKVESKET